MSLTAKTRCELNDNAQQLLDLVKENKHVFSTNISITLINAARVMSKAVIEEIKE